MEMDDTEEKAIGVLKVKDIGEKKQCPEGTDVGNRQCWPLGCVCTCLDVIASGFPGSGSGILKCFLWFRRRA